MPQNIPFCLPCQIFKLMERGLTLSDNEKIFAEHFLLNNNYYRFRGYTQTFQENNKKGKPFVDDVCFKNIVAVYNFDSELRSLIFNAIEKIEVSLRAQIIYYYSIQHGPFWYLDESFYKNKNVYFNFVNIFKKEFADSREDFVIHHKIKHSSLEPACWITLEVISFGQLSKLFQSLFLSWSSKWQRKNKRLFRNSIFEYS
ncbi:Abi family protein [Methanolapillus ohkumae]|uniref:Abi family protein n=1 Tax=Methanolapillus ohkumae TaxID=3028298 RepID=A0AA96V6K8_9EURY|nr:hypothetical protein MsAm2_02070 [Methanosarcinaceae archaeon Am2]